MGNQVELGWEREVSLGARHVPGDTALEARTSEHTQRFQKGRGRTCNWARSLTRASVLAGYVLSTPGSGEACR